jgi:hypothetical protein
MYAKSARLLIFGIWFSTMSMCMAAVLLAIPIRPNLIAWKDAFSLITPIVSLYVPLLAAFALFWFGPNQSQRNKKLSLDKWIAALSLTLFFQAFMLLPIIGIMFFSDAPGPTGESGLHENINGLIHLMSIFSPIATAPSAFLLGVESIDPK